MRDISKEVHNFSGSLLVAHPKLMDPNFNKSVILLSSHAEDDGALGVVINRPAGMTLGELDENFTDTALANIPVYKGGPVSTDQMILSAWKCQKESGTFNLYFGISEEKALELIENEPDTIVRGFLGYAGWSEGQLEMELEHDSWVVSSVNTLNLKDHDGTDMWREIINILKPELGYLADVPDNPSLN